MKTTMEKGNWTQNDPKKKSIPIGITNHGLPTVSTLFHIKVGKGTQRDYISIVTSGN